jgi:threonine/homoserine/homoserine lactone efflux protein
VLKYALLGSSFGFAAAIQPGPLQAFLVSRVAATGWRRTLPACLAPLVTDGPIAVVAVFLLGHLTLQVQSLLQAAGGILLVYFAWVTFLQWRGTAEATSTESAPRTFLGAVLVNLLNPNPYLGWALVLGPSVHAAWQVHRPAAVGLIVAFYGTMVVMLAGVILLVGTARRFGSGAQRALVGLSAGVLAGLGVYLLVSAAWRLAAV